MKDKSSIFQTLVLKMKKFYLLDATGSWTPFGLYFVVKKESAILSPIGLK